VNAWVVELNLIAGNWFEAIARATWQGAIATAVVWIVSRGIAAMPGRYKSWLWRLAFLKLLIALVWIAPISLALLPAKPVAVISTAPVLQDLPLGSPSLESVSPIVETRAPVDWRVWLLAAWMIGVLGGGVRVASHWCSARALRRSSRPVTEPMYQETLLRLARTFRLRRVPALCQTELTASPLLVGIFRPTIILPSHILRNCSEAQLEIMLAHELAHLSRRDLCWLWLFALCEVVFFFHPLVWLVRREWNLAAESACDELAVRVTRGAPSDYGARLIDIVAQISTQRPSAHILAVGMSETATTLKRRLKAMTAKKNPITIVGAIILMIIGTLALVPCRLVAQEPDVETLARLKEENAKLKQALDATRQEVEVLRKYAATAKPPEQTSEIDRQRFHEFKLEEFKKRAEAEKQLEFAEERLAELQKKFTETHPEVIAQRRKVQRLREYLEKMTIGTVPDDADRGRKRPFTPQQRELLLEEIKLAERQAETVKRQREVGRAASDDVLRVQRESLDLKLQLAELEGSKAEQKAVLLQQLKVSEELLKVEKKRIEMGTLPPEASIPFEREILRLKRALAAIE